MTSLEHHKFNQDESEYLKEIIFKYLMYIIASSIIKAIPESRQNDERIEAMPKRIKGAIQKIVEKEKLPINWTAQFVKDYNAAMNYDGSSAFLNPDQNAANSFRKVLSTIGLDMNEFIGKYTSDKKEHFKNWQELSRECLISSFPNPLNRNVPAAENVVSTQNRNVENEPEEDNVENIPEEEHLDNADLLQESPGKKKVMLASAFKPTFHQLAIQDASTNAILQKLEETQMIATNAAFGVEAIVAKLCANVTRGSTINFHSADVDEIIPDDDLPPVDILIPFFPEDSIEELGQTVQSILQHAQWASRICIIHPTGSLSIQDLRIQDQNIFLLSAPIQSVHELEMNLHRLELEGDSNYFLYWKCPMVATKDFDRGLFFQQITQTDGSNGLKTKVYHHFI